jgi:hypothetical protein
MDEDEGIRPQRSEELDVDPHEADDTEGSSMLTYELGRSVIAERQRQATDAARDAGRAREAREHKRATGRSLRDRLLGR